MQGDVLGDGRFQLRDVLDERGLAVVYRAWDLQAQDECAVKKLLPKHRKSARLRDALFEQASLLGKLEHKHVVRVRAIAGGRDPWYAMDLFDAGNVGTWVSVHGPMPPKMVIDIAVQVCKGLAVGHRIGISHGRLTASAILVDPRGICKLTAFGSSGAAALRERALDQEDLAPEQRDGLPPTPRSDVWQLGAVLVYLLTARPLSHFSGGIETAPIERSLVRVLKDALAEDRAARFADTYEFARALAGVKSVVEHTPKDTPGLALEREYTKALQSEGTPPWHGTAPAATTVPTERLILPNIEVVPPPRSLPTPVLISVGISLLLLFVIAGTVGSGAATVRAADNAAIAADEAYFAAVMASKSLRTDLVELGADRQRMQRAGAFFDETPLELEDIDDWLIATHREIDIVARYAGPGDAEALEAARELLQTLHDAGAVQVSAAERHRLAAMGTPARVAILLGLARGPE